MFWIFAPRQAERHCQHFCTWKYDATRSSRQLTHGFLSHRDKTDSWIFQCLVPIHQLYLDCSNWPFCILGTLCFSSYDSLHILYKEKLNPTVESFLSYFLTIYGPFWTFYNQLSIWFPLNNNNPLEEELRRSSKELLKLAPPHHLWYVAKEDGIDKKCKSSVLCSSIPTTIGNPGAKKVQQHLLLWINDDLLKTGFLL